MDLRTWASKEAESEQPEDEDGVEIDPVWFGSVAPEDVDLQTADEFSLWFRENEPALWSAIDDLARGTCDGDVDMVEHALEEFETAEQTLGGDYEPIEDRSQLMTAIQVELESVTEHGSPECALAIARGVAGVRYTPSGDVDEEGEELEDEEELE